MSDGRVNQLLQEQLSEAHAANGKLRKQIEELQRNETLTR
jgi:hypothetical protein